LNLRSSTGWHEGELEVQRRAGISDHVKLRGGVRDALPPHFIAFLAVQRFVTIATRDPNGALWCSMVPGWPGFAVARDPQTVEFARRAFDDEIVRHVLAHPRVGVLALDPSTRRRIRINGFASVEADAVTLRIRETFGNCQQYIQKRPADGPSPSASALVAIGASLEPAQQDWIASADTCFLASMHPVAGPDASHRGGRPGFVHVVDEQTLRFDDYDGNNMFQTLGNIVSHPAAAMLFVDFESGATLQLTGEAAIEWDAASAPTGRSVRFAIRAIVERRPAAPWSWPVVEYSPVNP
jgi:uncharacterized protein